MKGFELQSDLLSMYMAFLKHDHGTNDMDEIDIDGLYDTLDNFKKYVDKLLRDYITFTIKHRGQSKDEVLEEVLERILDEVMPKKVD